MREYFKKARNEIEECLRGFLREKETALARVGSFGPEACGRLSQFAAGGKLLRGGLTVLGYEGTGGSDRPAAVGAGAAMELFQSSLLIHDDIMDRDTTRRGNPTLFYQFARSAEENGMPDSYHYGESMGICLGDIASFLGFELLARSCGKAGAAAVSLAGGELAIVGLGQMLDVHHGHARVPLAESEVMNVYLHKTARYTVSLPLMLGASLAGAGEGDIAALEKFGEKLGMLFQLRDDELGLFGTSEELGKPAGSDLKEGKMTLIISYLLDAAPAGDRDKITGILSSGKVSDGDIDYMRKLVGTLGVDRKMEAMARKLATESRAILEGMQDFAPEPRRVLNEFVDYNLGRKF